MDYLSSDNVYPTGRLNQFSVNILQHILASTIGMGYRMAAKAYTVLDRSLCTKNVFV